MYLRTMFLDDDERIHGKGEYGFLGRVTERIVT